MYRRYKGAFAAVYRYMLPRMNARLRFHRDLCHKSKEPLSMPHEPPRHLIPEKLTPTPRKVNSSHATIDGKEVRQDPAATRVSDLNAARRIHSVWLARPAQRVIVTALMNTSPSVVMSIHP